jgi:FkbM family methyltransferase
MLGRALVGPGGQVTSVEPGDNNISDLRRNIEGNNFSNCKIIDKPLAEREKPVDFYLNADDSGGNALWDVAAYPGNVKSAASPVKNSMISTTLSSLLADIDLPVRLVKIDTEGAEEIILRGGIEGLATKAVPFVITELHEFGLEKLGCHQKSLRGLMAWIGYDCYVLGLKGNMPVYIPPGTRIAAPFIVNLLFARPGTLNDLYPEVAVDPRLF